MTAVRCCPLSGCDSDGPDFETTTKPKAGKVHACCECDEAILKGAEHELIKGRWNGVWNQYRTCLSCVEIRNHFACNGWIFGQVWDDIEGNFFPEMKAGGPCMEGLSPAAKARLFERRLAWLERVTWRERGRRG